MLVAIVLIGAALRLYRLDAQSVWFDESFSIANSLHSLPELFATLIRDVVHPPLHYLLLHGWFQIAGSGAVQARLISVFFGIASIPLLFLLTRQFADAAAGLCAALLLAISQAGVYFSQEARPYAQAQFFSLAAALAFLAFLRRPDLRRSTVLVVLSTVLMYTHYYGAGTLLALGFFWLIFRKNYSPDVFGRLTLVVLTLCAAYLPWMLTLHPHALTSGAVVAANAPLSNHPNLATPLAILSRFNNTKLTSIEAPTSIPAAALGLILFTLPACAALWCTRRKDPQGPILGLLLAVIPAVLAIGMGLAGAVFNYRHYCFAVPGYYLAAAIGWRCCLPRAAWRWAWLAVVIAFSGAALRANYTVPTKPDYREGLLPLAQGFRAGDCATVIQPQWRDRMHYAWEVYYRDRGTPHFVPIATLPALPADCGRLWVISDQTWWMNLDTSFVAEAKRKVEGLLPQYEVVERFARPAIELELWKRRVSGSQP